MTLSNDVRVAIRDASRNDIEKILESNGYQVYDSEGTEYLRQQCWMMLKRA